jgi:hypothetical protein
VLWQDCEVNEEFRPALGKGLTVAIAAVAVVSIVTILVTSGLSDALLTLPWMALFVTCCWAVFWNPRVVVSDAGVRLVNVTRTIDVPWPALVGIETKYSMTLDTAYGRFGAWAAPAPGAGSALRASIRDHRAGKLDQPVRAATLGELAGTSSADAATIVRRRWEQLRDAGHLDDPRLEYERPPIHWHWAIGAAVLGLSLVSVATLV